MSSLQLPPNVRYNSNSGTYQITGKDGANFTVYAKSQSDLDAYVRSVDSNTPIQVTRTDVATGNPNTFTFDPQAITKQNRELDNQFQLMNDTRRKAGVYGNLDGTYEDIRTGQTISAEEAAARIKAAGLPPQGLVAVTPKDSPAYAAAQQSIAAVTNDPSNLTANNGSQPVQAPASTGQGAVPSDPVSLGTQPQPDGPVRATATNAADVDLPPALAAQQVPPTTGAVPVDVAPVPAPTVRPITDPDIRTPPDLAVERAAEIAAVAQADSVGQGADTTLVVDRRIDPALGEGSTTLVVGPTTAPAPVNIDSLPGGQEALFAAATEPGAVDPDFDLELRNLEQAQEAERQRFLLTDLPRPPDVNDVAGEEEDQNPPVFEPGEIGDEDPEVAALLEQQRAIAQADISAAGAFGTAEPGLVNPADDPAYGGATEDEAAVLNQALAQQTAAQSSSVTPQVKNAQQQSTDSARVNTPASADWRVRLSLAPGSTYLYNAQGAEQSILAPLRRTGGVVFPYTPQIDMNYQARYDSVDLMHSNYRGQFYRNSSVDQVNIRGIFTAQDTREAAYLLAVITFFKSVTKMFYGSQDPNRGMPPPLVFLTGLGQYQFNSNPCVVSSFQYNLPSDVDYIRANGFNNYGINMDNRRQQSSGPPGTGILGAIAQVNRLLNSNLVQGVLGNRGGNQATNPVSSNNSKTNYTNSTYVPTKMEINLTLLPIQTRKQMSTQFDLNKFAQGKLLQTPGGFW